MSYLTHVPTDQIDEHWPRVRAGLERIKRKTQADWLPEHVYVALATGGAFLALVQDDGWLVWQRLPGDDRRGMLFVWALEGVNLAAHEAGVRQELQDMAQTMRLRVIRMLSPRKGWGADGFWKLTGYIFEREVP